MNLMIRLLQGKPEVLDLLKTNPFPEKPPRYLHAVLYDYHFTNSLERRRSGDWWKRTLLGLYCPVLTREGEQIVLDYGNSDG